MPRTVELAKSWRALLPALCCAFAALSCSADFGELGVYEGSTADSEADESYQRPSAQAGDAGGPLGIPRDAAMRRPVALDAGEDDGTRVDDSAGDAGRTSGPADDAGRFLGLTPRELYMQALGRWNRLEVNGGSTYWYVEENCLRNSTTGQATTVQVVDGGVRVLGTESFPREECDYFVDRFEPSVFRWTFPELLDQCLQTMTTLQEVTVDQDQQGLLTTCFGQSREPCNDGCGGGYHVREWAFGYAPDADAGYRDSGTARR